MFQDTILPEETILAGVGIQAGRNSGSPKISSGTTSTSLTLDFTKEKSFAFGEDSLI